MEQSGIEVVSWMRRNPNGTPQLDVCGFFLSNICGMLILSRIYKIRGGVYHARNFIILRN